MIRGCICKGHLESVDHLLRHCQFAKALWDLFSVAWASFGSITNCVLAWESYFRREMKRKKALVFPHVILWAFGEKETGTSLRVTKLPCGA